MSSTLGASLDTPLEASLEVTLEVIMATAALGLLFGPQNAWLLALWASLNHNAGPLGV